MYKQNDSAKEARSEMRGKLINVLGSVADQVNNFDQLDKTAGALNKITEVADEVTEESKVLNFNCYFSDGIKS